jgi:Uncharacterized protein conserved in bacteria
MANRRIYKVIFFNQGKIYEVYAQRVSQGDLYGFVEIEGLLFGERPGVVVDPGEERLKSEFAGVRQTYVPMHAVVRIDEVEKQGVAKIVEAARGGDNITVFPIPNYSPGRDPNKS